MRSFAVVVVALMLTACEPTPLREMKDAAVRSLKQTANDPASVQVESLVVIGRHQVCGRVQQKNGFGGLTGWRPFFSKDSTALVGGRDIEIGLVEQTCARTAEDAERCLAKFRKGEG